MTRMFIGGGIRCWHTVAAVWLILACGPVAESAAEVVAQFNFTAGSRASTASSLIATSSNFVSNSLNTNQFHVSSGLLNAFANAGYTPFSSADPWLNTLAPSGTNTTGGANLSGIDGLNIWKGFTITKAFGVDALQFEKISFQYGASGSGMSQSILDSMSLGVYFRETGSSGNFTFLGSRSATAIGTGTLGVGGDISALALQEIVFTQPLVSNGGEFRIYFRDNVSPNASSFSFSQTHRLDSVSLSATAVPEPTFVAIFSVFGAAFVIRRLTRTYPSWFICV